MYAKTVVMSTRSVLGAAVAARTFYTRLERAARVVCTSGDRVGLEPFDDLTGCYQKALGNAIRSVKEDHTLRDAAALGIDVPAQVAAK